MKVLYLKDNYDILLIITVPDVAYLKRIKRANVTDSLYILELHPLPPPIKMIEELGYAWSRMFRIVIIFKA